MKLDEILNKCMNEIELTKGETQYLLEQTKKEEVDKIFEAARWMRERYFGRKVFLYGFVYFSTYCKNNCNFCYYRHSNDQPSRYRKSLEEIVATAIELKEAGIHLIDLTMGEDPYFINSPEKIVEISRSVKEATDLPVMISPGVLSEQVIDSLVEDGVEWYALYQETHNETLYKQLRSDQDYQTRFHAKEYAIEQGMLVEEGLLVGVGNTISDTVNSFGVMKELGVSQVRTMTFIPQEGTPMEGCEQSGFLSELLNIAVMRLIFRNILIPASLDVEGLNGLEDRLNAGANVVTSIIPPKEGYAGVANPSSDINEGFRTIEGIQESLKRCGLENASSEDYSHWVSGQRKIREKVLA